MSDITRSEAIKTLKEHLSHWERLLQEHICEEQEGIDTISALKLAIASLEIDEAYQLEYESTTTKNDLGVDKARSDSELIARGDVLNTIKETAQYHTGDSFNADRLIRYIRELPSVTPQEPKTGHREYNDIYDHYLCGNCKTVVMDYDNYCPNCGAKMIEPQESEDKE